MQRPDRQDDLLPASVGHMQSAGRLPLGTFSTPIIPGRRTWIGMPHQLLHRRKVHTGIKQIARKGAPQIMG
jgi:hypothetical protein